MNSNSFVMPDIILADVLEAVDDARYEWNTRGYYISQMQQCLEELSFDTFFQETSEAFDFPYDTLSLPMPEGAFNLRQVYVFQGEKCDIGRSQVVWPKRNYITHGKGYIARDTGRRHGDPFYAPHRGSGIYPGYSGTGDDRNHGVNDHFFYNVQNGLIMFSSKCAVFPRVFLVYNGTGGSIGSLPIIPLFFRQTVKDYVCESVLRNRMAKEPARWNQLWQVYDRRLNKDYTYGDFKGSWYEAKARVKMMDSAEREGLKEYLSRGSW